MEKETEVKVTEEMCVNFMKSLGVPIEFLLGHLTEELYNIPFARRDREVMERRCEDLKKVVESLKGESMK